MLGLRVCKSIANLLQIPNLQRFATFARVQTLNLHTWQTRWQMWQWPRAVRRKSVANPLQTNYFATSLHACKFNANTKFASDLHIRKSVDYIKLANGLQTCKLVANMKFAIGLHHVLYVRKLVANNKFASDLHIRKCVDYTNYTKPLV